MSFARISLVQCTGWQDDIHICMDLCCFDAMNKNQNKSHFLAEKTVFACFTCILSSSAEVRYLKFFGNFSSLVIYLLLHLLWSTFFGLSFHAVVVIVWFSFPMWRIHNKVRNKSIKMLFNNGIARTHGWTD